MKSVPIPPPTEKVERESMTTIKVVIDSLKNNNRKLNLSDEMNRFKSYFTLDDLEIFEPAIIESVNQKNNEEEVIYIYIYCLNNTTFINIIILYRLLTTWTWMIT